jgi:ABC-2 type transport system permease protein
MVPVLLALLVLFSLGLGLLLSLLNVYFRDVQYLVVVGLNVLFYATPIVYTMQLLDDNAPAPVKLLVRLNPLTQFVAAMRDVVYDLQMPTAARFAGLVAVSVGSALIGWMLFRRYAGRVSEEL